MLGFLYMLICLGIGFVICEMCFPKLSVFGRTTYDGRVADIPSLFVCLPAWSIFGTIPMTWLTYILGYLFQSKRHPLFYANAILMPVAVGVIVLFFLWKRRKRLETIGKLFTELGTREIVFLLIVTMFYIFLFFWTFFYRDDKYYVGWSVASDFAPHIGMIRSFALGNNFPTSYSHFAGQDIKYHFLFQFFVGNLNYLGMRLDWAFNIPSIWFMVCTYMLLYFYAIKLTGKKVCGVLTTVLFSFRSSFAFLDFLSSLPKGTNFVEYFEENPGFIGTTEHEDWGLWNLNVYCNQRHLAIGLCVLLFVIIYFTQFLYGQAKRVKAESERKILRFLTDHPDEELLPGERTEYMVRESILHKEGWGSRNWTKAIACGVLLGLCSFFNGACVIACLCILFVMAWASDRRLEFALTAAITVILSYLSTRFFIDGSAVNPVFYFGFLAKNRTISGVIKYLVTLCGLLPFTVLAAMFFINRVGKFLTFAFTAPIILAFTVSMTIDIAVNHKYVMIGLMLLCIPASLMVNKIWQQRGAYAKIITVMLVFALTVTGVFDFGTVLVKNDQKIGNAMYMDEDSDICRWVMDNATSKDIFLTDWYSLNEFVLGGAMLYYGWPYYAWSAGYDTYGREALVHKMYEASTPDELDGLVKQCGIRYIVVDRQNRESEEYTVNEENIIATYKLVFNDGSTRIFDASKRLSANEGGESEK